MNTGLNNHRDSYLILIEHNNHRDSYLIHKEQINHRKIYANIMHNNYRDIYAHMSLRIIEIVTYTSVV
jgi:hypothetical protein